MIVDKIENFKYYAGLHPSFSNSIAFIQRALAENLAPGRYEIDGDALYASVQEYETFAEEKRLFEGHKKYVDLQFIAKGRERIKVIDVSRATEAVPYDPAIEAAFFTANGAPHVAILSCGDFAIFLPNDLHCPGLRADGVTPDCVKKIIVKLLIED